VVVPTIGKVAIPGLSDIPQVGAVLLDHDVLLYFAFLLVPVVWFLLYRTKWGLSIRAVGEMPAAADSAGSSVRRIRWMGVFAAGGLSGLAGAYLAVVEVGIFKEGMSGGRGFLAIVAVIFGRWNPIGVLGACLVLGGTDALQLRLAASPTVPRVVWAVIAIAAAVFVLYQVFVKHRGVTELAGGVSIAGIIGIVLLVTAPDVTVPNEFWRSLPFLFALILLAGALTRARMPSKLTSHTPVARPSAS